MLHIIINPASSSGHGHKKWEAIEKLFQEAGAEYTVHRVSEGRSIESICSELTSGDEECTLVLLGGDGSMNGAVNGIVNFAKTKIGFIPIGSGNDLSLDLGFPNDVEELVRTIVREEVVRESDIGRITFHNRSELLDPITHMPLPESETGTPGDGSADRDKNAFSALSPKEKPFRLFNISAGIGFDAACCQEAEASPFKKILNKIHLGKMIYLLSAIHLILTAPMKPAKITAVSGSTQKKESRVVRHLLFAVFMNHRYEGGGFLFCPEASDSDALLDSCVAGDLNRLNFFRIFPTAYKGNHLRYKGVDGDRAASYTIQTKIPLWVHTDGEVSCKSSHITVDIAPWKLRMIV